MVVTSSNRNYNLCLIGVSRFLPEGPIFAMLVNYYTIHIECFLYQLPCSVRLAQGRPCHAIFAYNFHGHRIIHPTMIHFFDMGE